MRTIAVAVLLLLATPCLGADKAAELFREGMIAIKASQKPGLSEAAQEILHDKAIAAFREMLVDDPTLVRVRLELARAFFLKGEDGLAKQHFEQVLAGNPPAPVVLNVQRFLATIRARRRWELNAGFALAPDTNIGGSSDQRIIYIYGLPFERDAEDLATSGIGLSVWTGGEYQHPLRDRLRLRAGASASRREYERRRFDQTFVSGHVGHHLTIGEDAPAGVSGDWEQGLPDIPEGELFVEFIDEPPTGGRPGSEALSYQRVAYEYDKVQRRWEKKLLQASSVEMNRDEFRDLPDYQAISVLVHEMLHSLGLQGHVDEPEFEDSNMYNSWFRLDGSLPAIDAAGIQALYTRLDEETEPEDLSISSLGAWSRVTIHLGGELGEIEFGVGHGNGVSMPWTSGIDPSTALADNDSLSGTATWTGGLLGFTPDLEAVGGNAELSVDLDTLDGRAEFTELQSWAEGTTPGTLGTGSQWNTGSLGYTIAVAANYLRSTGGDDGTVNGQFYGSDHESVAGSVERDDLTAAFGAAR